MTKYWMAVASRDHVQKGVKEGIAQVCHGKVGPLSRMKKGDWIIYYSPTHHFGEKNLYQAFTAIGQVKAGSPYQFEMTPNFTPWRRDVSFIPSKDVSIKPLLEQISFIRDKKRWGFPFRFGCFEIPVSDFELIAKAMRVVT